MLNIISPLQYACLNWIVNNNRCSLFSLPNSVEDVFPFSDFFSSQLFLILFQKKIQGLPDDMVQFVMSQTTPEKEANFQALKASHGSEFAFHGMFFLVFFLFFLFFNLTFFSRKQSGKLFFYYSRRPQKRKLCFQTEDAFKNFFKDGSDYV